MTVMRVIAKGRNGRIVYDMVDRFDERNSVSSMGKTTGYTASIVTQLLGAGEIGGKGTVPPEEAVQGASVERLLSELERRGVRIGESQRHPPNLRREELR
jgi:lysine 6-dehydrogenase